MAFFEKISCARKENYGIYLVFIFDYGLLKTPLMLNLGSHISFFRCTEVRAMSIFDIFNSAGRKMRIVRYGHRSLRGVSLPIVDIDQEIKDLARRMTVTMQENEVPGVGLAAPQVGVNKRLIVVDTRCDSKERERRKRQASPGEMLLEPMMPVALVNPEIVSSSKETECACEGCLSLPGVDGDVTRPKKVVLRAKLLSGEQIMVECGGLLARCLQHEIDHLNGILFIDHSSREEQEAARPLMDEMAADEARLTGR